MNLDELRHVLFAAIDVATVAAALAFAVALTWVAVITRRLVHEPRLITYDIEASAGLAPASELLFAHLRAVVGPRGPGMDSSTDPVVLGADGSASGLRLWIAASESDARRLRATLGTIWPEAHLVPRPARSTLDCATLEWRPTVGHGARPREVPGSELTLPRALARAAMEDELAYELVLRPTATRPQPLIGHLSGSGRSRRPRGTVERAAERDRSPNTFECRLRVRAHARSASRAQSLVRDLEPVVHVLSFGSAIHLGPARASDQRYRLGMAVADGRLGPAELASLFPLGPLAAAVSATTMKQSSEGERLLGVRDIGGAEHEVRLSLVASRQHLHVLGPTGTGKSTLLLNLITQDIAAGRGCAVLDPKGDLVRELLGRIPRRRLEEVVYLGPDEGSRAIGINPLALGPGEDPHLAAENVLSIFKRIYEENWGPRTDDVLKSCLVTLVAVPGSTLAHIPALLNDGALRRRLTAHVDDAVGVGGFWRLYERLSEAKRLEVTAPLQNKLRDFLIRPRLRHLLCQTQSSVDIGVLMDRGGILLADLGTESASALAGSFVVARLWQAARSRQALHEEQRRDFLLYIDEFQSFLGIGGPFAEALAQARGLRLSLTLANQHLGQLPREIRDAVAANARSRIAFRCSSLDASNLAADFAPLNAEALVALRPFEAAVRLPSASGSFAVRSLPPARPHSDVAPAEEVLATSAARYGRDVAAIDARLRELLSSSDAPGEPSHERMS